MNRTRRFLSDRSGAALLWFGLSVPVVLGAAGLGVDVTLWYMDKRILQTASDAAAIAAAHVIDQDGTKAEATAAAKAEIARNDFAVSAVDDIAVNIPPLNGPNTGTAGYVEVIITKQRTNYLTRILGQDTTDIQARAVGAPAGKGESCVLALDHDMDAAIAVEGTAVTNISCGVASNSRSAKSFEMVGTANLTADTIQAYGDIMIGTNSSLSTSIPPKPYAKRVDDPYDDLEIQGVPANCYPDDPPPGPVTTVDGVPTVQGDDNGNPWILNPGKFCGGLHITGAANVIFNPGTYYIFGGDMIVDGQSTTFGTDVTFVLTGNNAADIGSLRIAGGTTNTLTAPSAVDDDYAGVLFYQDRRAISFTEVKVKGQWTEVIVNNEILGGALTDLEGAIYFPSQGIRYGGGSGVGDGCTQIIGLKVTFAGNSNVLNDPDACAALRVRTIGLLRVILLE